MGVDGGQGVPLPAGAASGRDGSGPRAAGRAVGDLPLTSWAVLGLLSFGSEMSGYDLKKAADRTLPAFYWSPSYSQVYAELKRLERLGLVEARDVDGGDARGKRVYSITTAGRDAVAWWVGHAPVEPPVLKHGVMLRVWLGHLNDPVRLRSVVREHRDYAEGMRERAAADAAGLAGDPERAYPRAVLRWAERYYAAERDLADQLVADLDELTREGDAAGQAGRADG